MTTSELWWSTDEDVWEAVLDEYWSYILRDNLQVEKKFEKLDSLTVEAMSVNEFYNFLHDEYFIWKYTAKNRLATTRMSLQKYKNEIAR